MRFRLAPHPIRPGVQIVEVFDDDDEFLATICPADTREGRELRVISKHVVRAQIEKARLNDPGTARIFFRTAGRS